MPYSVAVASCYVSIKKSKEGQGKAVALPSRSPGTFQTVVVVDDVIDVFDEADVVWAALVNVDPSRHRRDPQHPERVHDLDRQRQGADRRHAAARPHDPADEPRPQDAMDPSTSTTTSTRCTGAISTPTSRASRWNGRSRHVHLRDAVPVDYEIRFMDVELECPACRRKMRDEEAAAVDERWG